MFVKLTVFAVIGVFFNTAWAQINEEATEFISSLPEVMVCDGVEIIGRGPRGATGKVTIKVGNESDLPVFEVQAPFAEAENLKHSKIGGGYEGRLEKMPESWLEDYAYYYEYLSSDGIHLLAYFMFEADLTSKAEPGFSDYLRARNIGLVSRVFLDMNGAPIRVCIPANQCIQFSNCEKNEP